MRALRILATIYATLHLVVLYVYQFQSAQELVPVLPLKTTNSLLTRLYDILSLLYTVLILKLSTSCPHRSFSLGQLSNQALPQVCVYLMLFITVFLLIGNVKLNQTKVKSTHGLCIYCNSVVCVCHLFMSVYHFEPKFQLCQILCKISDRI